jgi:hypothetical protein
MDPTSSSTLTNLMATQVTMSALIVYFLEWLKQSAWFPWLTAETKTLNRWAAALMALAAAIGIHAEFNPDTGTLLVTGLTMWGIGHAAFDMARSWIFQQVIYDGVVAKKV